MSPLPARPAAFLLIAALSVLAAGCETFGPIGPFEPQGCPSALLEGTLVPDERAGLGVHQADVDVIYPVEWPDGWSVQEGDGVRQLVDEGGGLVGREGDRFSAGGGFTPGPNEVFQPCGGIEITPADE